MASKAERSDGAAGTTLKRRLPSPPPPPRPPAAVFDGQIITLTRAAAGYANTGLLTVVFLYLVAEGVTQTGGLELIMVRTCVCVWWGGAVSKQRYLR